MNIPENAVDLVMAFEGFYPRVYICPAGYWTIGFGHRCEKDHPPITKEQGEVYLAEDLQDALIGTLQNCPGLTLVNEKWLGAIIDFTFNLGARRLRLSTLRRKINARQWDEIPYQLSRWVYADGQKLKGLILRRQAESSFF